MNNVQLTLLAAVTLISRPADWCRGADAVDKEWNALEGNEDGACRWCASGAIYAVAPTLSLDHRAYRYLSKAATELFGNTDPVNVNDSRSRRAVARMFGRAIELAA